MQRLLESSYEKETVKIWDVDGHEDVEKEEDEGALENKIHKKQRNATYHSLRHTGIIKWVFRLAKQPIY